MHDLLEDLNPPFNDKFKKEVDLTEITRFSLNLHKNSALVITNNYAYLLNKKLISTALNKIPLKDLQDIILEGNKIIFKTKKGNVNLPVTSDKKSQAMKLVNKLKELLS